MNVAEARDLVLGLILAGQPQATRLMVDPASPDGDRGKFLIDGKIARVIHRMKHSTIMSASTSTPGIQSKQPLTGGENSREHEALSYVEVGHVIF
jgi:hypothetical protein